MHVRTTGALRPATERRGAASGWAIDAQDVGHDGLESRRLSAHGAVATQATHPHTAPPHAAGKHSAGHAEQRAIAAALAYASDLLQRSAAAAVTTTVGTFMAYHHLRRAHSVGTSPGRAAGGAAAPAQQQAAAQPAGSRKRQRSRDHPPTGGSDATSLSASKNQAQANLTKLEALSKRFPGKITVTAPHAAVPLELKLAAQRAASLPDLDARVFLRHGRAISVPQWDETRTWDPGD